jgi:methionyl-tRNA formyltransferase
MPGQLPSVIQLCGKGRGAVEALHFVLATQAQLGLKIPLVVCPSRSDTGSDSWFPSLLGWARTLEVQCIDNLYAYAGEPNLLLLSVQYDRIIRVERFASGRLFNLHFSKLPQYRGVHTSIWPILNGESEVGVSLHKIDAGIDTGDIVAQEIFALSPAVTARQLYELFLDCAGGLFQRQFIHLLLDQTRLLSQDHSQATYYSQKSLDVKQASLVDLADPAEKILRQVRAFYFPEYQTARLGDRGVAKARIVGESKKKPTSKLLDTAYGGVYVAGDQKAVEFIWTQNGVCL